MENLDKVNILLVDDDPGNLLALEAALADLGQNLVKAESGTEALRYLLKQDYAAVLLDVQMPKINGFETAALIRERERSKHTPIIFITAIGTTLPDVTRGYSVGAVDYIIKPFEPEILRSKVAVLSDLFRMREAVRRQAEELAATNQQLADEIVERRRAEAALQETNAELESFAYSVSHDLRAPLLTMQGLATALLEDNAKQLDPTGREYAQRIVDNSERMQSLIQDILAYSRISRAELELKPINLDEVVHEAQSRLETLIKAKKAEITVEEPLPRVIGHEPTLAQIVVNLVDNAIKFVAPGVQPKVRICAEEISSPSPGGGHWIRLLVMDNGIGISPEHQTRIFRVFERLHGGDQYPGSGVGLAIVRKGMQRMGGRVGLESTPGLGTTFWIELPSGEDLDGTKP